MPNILIREIDDIMGTDRVFQDQKEKQNLNPLAGNDRPGGPCKFDIPVESPPNNYSQSDSKYSHTATTLDNSVEVIRSQKYNLSSDLQTNLLKPHPKKKPSLLTKIKKFFKN
jgi:hypothetical protein